MAKKGELTPKQEAFVREYLIDLNATQAAIRAGYSAKTAKDGAAQLLANISVKKAIDAAMDDEPVVQYGPFVMNTEGEIRQAITDFNSGRFGDINAFA